MQQGNDRAVWRAKSARVGVARAFRTLSRGSARKAARAAAVAFYRSGLGAWARRLG